MNLKSDMEKDKGKETSRSTSTNPIRSNASEDELPPVYYDSEPSSQPPRYLNASSTESQITPATNHKVTTTSNPKPANPHRNSAPAATVAAILASPYDDLDAQRRAERKKKTLRERWRDFKERNFSEDHNLEPHPGYTSAEWNVQGGKW
jgi:hypothetical protein